MSYHCRGRPASGGETYTALGSRTITKFCADVNVYQEIMIYKFKARNVCSFFFSFFPPDITSYLFRSVYDTDGQARQALKGRF